MQGVEDGVPGKEALECEYSQEVLHCHVVGSGTAQHVRSFGRSGGVFFPCSLGFVARAKGK